MAKKTTRLVLRLAMIGVGVLAAWGIYKCVKVYKEFSYEISLQPCKSNIREIARDTEFFRPGQPGERWWMFVDQAELKTSDGGAPVVKDQNWICPCSGQPYVYSPVSPSGDRVVAHDGNRFVMWCPQPCHSGRRIFMIGELASWDFSDEEVSWYFQRILRGNKPLTSEELQQENAYRAEHGMAPLPGGG